MLPEIELFVSWLRRKGCTKKLLGREEKSEPTR